MWLGGVFCAQRYCCLRCSSILATGGNCPTPPQHISQTDVHAKPSYTPQQSPQAHRKPCCSLQSHLTVILPMQATASTPSAPRPTKAGERQLHLKCFIQRPCVLHHQPALLLAAVLQAEAPRQLPLDSIAVHSLATPHNSPLKRTASRAAHSSHTSSSSSSSSSYYPFKP
jgi:hypothetical protein